MPYPQKSTPKGWSRREVFYAGFGAANLVAYSKLWGANVTKAAPHLLQKDPKGLLDLPPDFRYQIIAKSGMTMSDGYTYAGRPDGMACFQDGKQLILMVNHELSPSLDAISPYNKQKPAPAKEAFDPNGIGGVSRLVLDSKNLSLRSSNLVLVGTHRNCAGGPSPWGWLSCEENISAGHGYVFLCPTEADKLQPPRRIAAYGRFHHEAVAIDPKTYYAYLSEDRGDSCIYRFVPASKSDPFRGQLQALKVKAQPKFSLSGQADIHQSMAIEWVNLDDPDAPKDDLRYQAQAKGAAILSRGEGVWQDGQGAIYIVSTSGGKAGSGQIFKLRDGTKPSIELVTESRQASALDGPDNITVAPWGDLFVAEDGGHIPHIRAINPSGEIFDVARNSVGYGEFAGVCFSADGSTLFANMQVQGLTVAIQGPFQRYLKSARPNRNA